MKPNLLVALALGIGGFYLYKKLRIDKGAINPASRNNFVYQASGEIGLKIADLFPSVAERRVAQMLQTPIAANVPAKSVAPSSGYELSPASFGPTDANGRKLSPAELTSFDLYTSGAGFFGLGRWL
jgi:hypothetical protein